MIDQDLSLYYRHREGVERTSARRASDARARRMHFEMAAMYARALQVGCSVDDLINDVATSRVQAEVSVEYQEAA